MGTIITATPADKRSPQRVGTRIVWEGQITLSSSYLAGGDVLNAKTLGMNQIDGGILEAAATKILALVIQTDRSTAKMKATVCSTGVEVADAVNQSSLVCNARIIGR